MIAGWVLLLVSLVYIAILFGVAYYGDRRPLYPERTWLRRLSERESASSWILMSRRRARSTRSACALFLCCDFSSWHMTTMPVGLCVIRTAESVVLTLCPPGPLERYTSISRSLGSI